MISWSKRDSRADDKKGGSLLFCGFLKHAEIAELNEEREVIVCNNVAFSKMKKVIIDDAIL